MHSRHDSGHKRLFTVGKRSDEAAFWAGFLHSGPEGQWRGSNHRAQARPHMPLQVPSHWLHQPVAHCERTWKAEGGWKTADPSPRPRVFRTQDIHHAVGSPPYPKPKIIDQCAAGIFKAHSSWQFGGALTSFPLDCQIKKKNDNSQHDVSCPVWMKQNCTYFLVRS